ncbi:S-layer homology domain-containing protein [Bhargavaea ginsengi]|uniref:S-layer homology domain-containing protein n=1 Tax=Bhargavaea ginsengi TaxID=426757 RepID=A0A1H7AH05_9BACL|nr:S-layer homology domain-containing protein [Bhargavaea ginsengi]SEJ63177.1 S-layer homology domain-containing protein [Bhargavaea ginsengi]
MATKTYKKFLTGAATAAMVVSAVAPVAAQGQDVADQANSSFSDIGPSSSHYTNVIEARELGFLSGYTDGTFKPNKDLNRGDVAKMLGKYVVASSGLTLDEYVAANNIADVENFSDVPNTAKDQELVTYSKIVKDAGIFQGSNNNLMATKLMPRDQIAAVLVRAFDLKDKEGATEVEDGANSGYVDEIEILLENGVSNANPYRPFETTSRAQFASFLVRAYKVSEGLDPSQPLPEEPGDEVEWEGDISIEASKANLAADGKDTSVLTFSVLDADGNVDTSADDVVLELSTTHGTFASERVTVQDGVATATLTSEQSNTDLTARIDAVVIEAGEGSKDLIGKKAATAEIGFVAYDQAAETLNVVGAESNQVDRVTLFFDRDVELEDFVVTSPASGAVNYQIRTADGWSAPTPFVPATVNPEDVRHALNPGAIVINDEIGADAELDGILGLKPVAGNAKAIEVILEKDAVLADNSQVDVEVNYTSLYGKNSTSSTDFILTDARTPEVTQVTNSDLQTVAVKFSESIVSADFKLDGSYVIADDNVEYGEFDARTLEDNRNMAYVGIGADYNLNTPPTPAGYMAAGPHKIEVSNSTDFAGNVGKTQNFDFTVAANTTAPSATVEVASPEQFHVTFNTEVPADEVEDFQFQVYDEDTKTWVDSEIELLVTDLGDNVYSFELTEDWTQIYDTDGTGENYYNDKYRIAYAKDALVNVANGVTNAEAIELDLNYSGSPLNTRDSVSPTITDVAQQGTAASFIVTTSEPVKLAGEADNAGETLSQTQEDSNNGTLPEVKATFTATTVEGKTITINGTVGDFVDDYDNKFEVDADEVTVAEDYTVNRVVLVEAGTYTVQELVNLGYLDTDFTLELSQLTDDVGNTANTATYDFEMAATTANPAATPFFIENAALEGNVVTVTFSEGVVSTGGANDASAVTQWNINGHDLPNGTSITVSDEDEVAGNETVVITLPEDNTVIDEVSNVITVNRELKSFDGSALVGTNSVVLGAAPLVVAE